MMRPPSVRTRFTVIGVLLAALALAGCAGAATGASPGGPSPAASVASSPAPAVAPITSADEAVARLLAVEPWLAGIRPEATGLIGQSRSYTVGPAPGGKGFVVRVRVGWGDCEAGCINEHSWVYDVSLDGTVVLASEAGDDPPPGVGPSSVGAGKTGIRGLATAGPVCPVERNPPDPSCAPRPVAGATIIIRDGSGAQVAAAVSGADGAFFVELQPGAYVVDPLPVPGLMGTAVRQSVSVAAGSMTVVQLDYDTGIR
jgi:hypothetical protein